MSTIAFVILGPEKPSTRLRILPLVQHLQGAGHAVSTTKILPGLFGRLSLLFVAAKCDILIIQKKLFSFSFVKLLARINRNLIFDVDDAVMFHELERGQPLTGKYFQRFAAVAATSRLVVTGNAYVAEFARAARPHRDENVAVLRTPIDTRVLTARSAPVKSDKIVVGWIGTKGNLQQLMPLAAALRKLQEAFPGVQLRLITDGTIDMPGVDIETKAWSAEEEVADLHGFDIGIMPLDDSLWNRGKGGFKLLQYMAAGLPAVASPVGINAEIVQHGENGFLARSPDEWTACLLTLAHDAALRQQIGQAARQTIEQEYALDVYLERYAALIEGCLR